MKLGLLCYATETGLGYQTQALYRYLKPDKTLLVDISSFNHLPVYSDWYNFDIRTKGIPTNEEIDRFLDGLDIVFMCETALNYYLIKRANELGIKTIIQINPEFCDYFQRDLPKPTFIALPTLWLRDKFRQFDNVISLPVPIDRLELPQRMIKKADIFFHIAGNPAIHDRNGTLDFITAVKLIQNEIDARFILYIQRMTRDIKSALKGAKIEVQENKPRLELFAEGDVLVLPRKYGGLCLPAQEAVGTGIPVIMPDIEPNNLWMPKNWLVRPVGKFTFKTRLDIDAYNVDPKDIANVMLLLYNHPELVALKAKEARNMAWMMSWDNLLPKYKGILESCMSLSSV